MPLNTWSVRCQSREWAYICDEIFDVFENGAAVALESLTKLSISVHPSLAEKMKEDPLAFGERERLEEICEKRNILLEWKVELEWSWPDEL